MGKRGPKKTPTNILKIRGSSLVKDRPKNEPIPVAGMPEPPEWVQGEALAEWNRKAPLLYEQGTLTLVDGNALGAYCVAHEIVYQALEGCRNKKTGKLGLIQKTTNGNITQSCLMALVKTGLRDMNRFAAELGMTAVGRTGINVPKPKTKRESKSQRWIAKQNRGA
jgi:P27 family predicted phage terminase small subunit